MPFNSVRKSCGLEPPGIRRLNLSSKGATISQNSSETRTEIQQQQIYDALDIKPDPYQLTKLG